MTPLDALKVGLVQCLALIPGTSRSGATIIGGMLFGLRRKAATDFSFYLAIPTLIGAGAYSLYKERALLSMADLPLFASGLLFSFISRLALRALAAALRRHATTSRRSPGTASSSASSCWSPRWTGWVTWAALTRRASLSAASKTRSHTPWPSFRPRFSNLVSGR